MLSQKQVANYNLPMFMIYALKPLLSSLGSSKTDLIY